MYRQSGQKVILKDITQFHERKCFQNDSFAKDGMFSDPSLTLLHSTFNHDF